MPSATDTAALLQQAKNALHELLLGKAVVTLVDQNGERIEFVAANPNRLRAYIKDLETELGVSPPLGPMRLVF